MDAEEFPWSESYKRWLSLANDSNVIDAWYCSPEEQAYRRDVLPRVGYVDDALEHLHIRLFYPNGEWPGATAIDVFEAYEAIDNRTAFDFVLGTRDDPADAQRIRDDLGYDPRECDNLQHPWLYDPEEGRNITLAVDEWRERYSNQARFESLDDDLLRIKADRRVAWLKRRFDGDFDAAKAWAKTGAKADAGEEV